MRDESGDNRIINGMWLPVLVAILVMAFGCTDAEWTRLKALGDKGEIECYSGGVKIYEGKSTGRIGSEEGSDGWYFQENGTDKLIRVSGDCVIRN